MRKTKDQVQKEAGLAFKENNGKGIVVAATGVGKSRIPINHAKRYYSSPSARILLVVPTEKLRDVNWKAEFEICNAMDIYDNIERSCYVSISKIKGKKYDFVILDEVHNITEMNSEFFANNEVREVIGLTATMPDNQIKLGILNSLGLRPIYTVTVDEAVTWGLISPYKVVIVETRLDTVHKNVKAGTKQKPFMQTEFDAYQYLTKSIENLSNIPVKSSLEEKRLMLKIFERMRFIYNLETKSQAAEFILANIIPKEERTLIFSGSIKQAERLNPYSYHSKSNNSNDFDAFVNKQISRLSCVNSLNEGHNLPDVDNALIAQLNSKELNLIQRVGRIVRYREGHIAGIWIVVAKGTMDEVWTEKALLNFHQDNVETITFQQLKLNYT